MLPLGHLAGDEVELLVLDEQDGVGLLRGASHLGLDLAVETGQDLVGDAELLAEHRAGGVRVPLEEELLGDGPGIELRLAHPERQHPDRLGEQRHDRVLPCSLSP
jgi:hypothetical protein